MSEKKSILEKISEGQVWKSIFRGGGVPTTRRQRMMVVLNSVFLHLHPVRLPKHAWEVSQDEGAKTQNLKQPSFFVFV